MSAFTRTDVYTDIGYFDDSNYTPTHKYMFTHNQCAAVCKSKLCTAQT